MGIWVFPDPHPRHRCRRMRIRKKPKPNLFLVQNIKMDKKKIESNVICNTTPTKVP